jgi:hypothetical protein
MILFLMLLPVLIGGWFAGGVSTYRRVGYLALNSPIKHQRNCASGNPHDREYGKCLGCNYYETTIKSHDHQQDCESFGYDKVLHRGYYKYPTVPVKPVWSYEVCNKNCEENQRKVLLNAAKSAAFTIWPVLLAIMVSKNAKQRYVNTKGNDWSFFIKPNQVLSTEEKQVQIKKCIDDSLEELDQLERKIEALK